MTSGSVTALVDRLERAGFVERQRSNTDRRSVLVGITKESYPRIAALYGRVGGAVRARFEGVDDDGLQAAAEILRTFAAGCADAGLPTSPPKKRALSEQLCLGSQATRSMALILSNLKM